MPARETKAQRTSRFAALLADYDARSRELRKLAKDVDAMKAQIRDEVPPGTYGDFIRGEGTPREIVDQAAVKAAYAARDEAMPTKMTDAPITVTFAGTKK